MTSSCPTGEWLHFAGHGHKHNILDVKDQGHQGLDLGQTGLVGLYFVRIRGVDRSSSIAVSLRAKRLAAPPQELLADKAVRGGQIHGPLLVAVRCYPPKPGVPGVLWVRSKRSKTGSKASQSRAHRFVQARSVSGGS